MFGQQEAELLGRGSVVIPHKRGELHIGGIEHPPALFLGGPSYSLGLSCLRKTAFGGFLCQFGLAPLRRLALLGTHSLKPSPSFVGGLTVASLASALMI